MFRLWNHRKKKHNLGARITFLVFLVLHYPNGLYLLIFTICLCLSHFLRFVCGLVGTQWTESCCCSVAQLYLTLCDPTPGFPVLHHLPEFAQTHVHWVSGAINHLILCRPFPLLPSVFPSIRVFSNESALCIRWPKYWSFSFSIRWIFTVDSFRIDWFDLLVVQGTLKSLLQDRSSKTSILQRSALFMEPGTKTLPQVLIWVSLCTTHIHFCGALDAWRLPGLFSG